MNNFLNRLFRLEAGELAIVLSLGLVLSGNSLARQVSGIVAISGFLDEGGVNQFLIVVIIDYLFILLVSALQSLVVDRFDRVKLVMGMTLGFAVVFTLMRLLFTFKVPNSINYALLYIISEQQWLAFPLFFWVLANDIFNPAQARRLIPVISSWNFVGKLIGIGIALIAPSLFFRLNVPNEEILTLNILIYLLIFVVLLWGTRNLNLRHTHQKQETVQETLTEGWDFIKNVPAFRYLTFTIIGAAVADTVIEFRFLVVTDATFLDAGSYQQFYSIFRLVSTLVAFAIQGFLTSRLINSFGLKNVFFIFPIAALISALWMIAMPGFSAAVSAMILIYLARETVDDSARKAYQALVPEERRGRVSTFLDSYVISIGTMTGAILAGIVVIIGLQTGSLNYFYGYLAVAVLGGVIAIWSVWKMRKEYDSSMLNWRLKRRQRRGLTGVMKKLDI
jgi:ATP/ADP translocase